MSTEVMWLEINLSTQEAQYHKPVLDLVASTSMATVPCYFNLRERGAHLRAAWQAIPREFA